MPSASLCDRLLRLCDIAIALFALVFFLPLMAIISLAIFLTDPGPVVFRHVRVGKDGRPFRCLKFRSMVTDADARLTHLLSTDPAARIEWARHHKLAKDPRITPIGHILRKSSLDELPQIINVLCGEMSCVGPRPIVVEETARYGRYLPQYLNCTPGLTGLWQVNGRSCTTYRRRVALDVVWSRQRNVQLYWAVLFRTIPAVLKAQGSA